MRSVTEPPQSTILSVSLRCMQHKDWRVDQSGWSGPLAPVHDVGVIALGMSCRTTRTRPG